DVELETLAARPQAGDPEGPVGSAEHEVVATLAGCVRQIAEQVSATEVSEERDRLTVELPRLECQSPDRRCGCRLRLGDASHIQEELLAGFRPICGVASVGKSADARVTGFETSNVDDLPSHFDRPAARGHILQNRSQLLIVGAQHHARSAPDELTAEQDVLQMEKTWKLADGLDRRQTTGRRLSVDTG